MADISRKLISGNNVRQSDTLASVDKFGNKQKITNNVNNGAASYMPSLVDRLCEMRQYIAYVETLTLTDADTTYSWVIPEGTKKYTFKARTAVDVKYGFYSTQFDDGTYGTLNSGIAFENPNNFEPLSTTTLYLQSASAGTVIEFTYWK